MAGQVAGGGGKRVAVDAEAPEDPADGAGGA